MTTGPTYGELFAGYGGLGLGVQSVLGGELAWTSEFAAAPSRVLAHHWPDVPNLGDITQIDWTTVPPVDILTGGSPCQDLSHAGRRAGMRPGTRSGLWSSMARAIDVLRPHLVVWENVRGALSAEADSGLEPCPGCVGNPGDDGPVLRALGRVLGDLSDLGYDAAWYGLRAADVGAPHGRFRVFVFAWPADAPSDPRWILNRNPRPAADTDDDGRSPFVASRHGAELTWPASDCKDADLVLFRTPTAQLAVNGGSQHPDKRKAGGHGPTLADEVEHLLPTPAVNDMGARYTPQQWDEWTGRMKALHGNGNGHGRSLEIEAKRLLPTPTTKDAASSGGSTPANVTLTDAVVRTNLGQQPNPRHERLLPTPRATDGTNGGPNQRGSSGDLMLPSAVQADRWGDYAAAVHRWETLTGQPAPTPTTPGKKGAPRLDPAFVEWMMGLNPGHVTNPAIGLTRNEQLKALGNGVCPQQSAAATRALLTDLPLIRKTPA